MGKWTCKRSIGNLVSVLGSLIEFSNVRNFRMFEYRLLSDKINFWYLGIWYVHKNIFVIVHSNIVFDPEIRTIFKISESADISILLFYRFIGRILPF